MTQETPTLEVEVLEIDGAAPPAPAETSRNPPPRRPWQAWQGRILKLDRRWWPLWVVLGAVAVFLVLTVGVVIGLLAVIYKILKTLVTAPFR
ncbi:hypothetical protein HQ447_13205 [bacterium]|nr:hypothetical protein [bacterium]